MSRNNNSVVSGVLTRAGSFFVQDEEVVGFVVSSSVEELWAAKRLPMYQRVLIVPECEFSASATLAAIVEAAHRATEAECTCGGNPAEDPQCCPACRVYHCIEAAKRASQNTLGEGRTVGAL